MTGRSTDSDAGNTRREEALAVDGLGGAGAVQVRRDAAVPESESAAEQQAEVDVLGCRYDALVEHDLNFLGKCTTCALEDLFRS